MQRLTSPDPPTLGGAAGCWRAHFVLPLTTEWGAFVASRTCQLPSLPAMGTEIAVTQDRSLRPEVERITCWLDGYVGIRLSEVGGVCEEMLVTLEADSWRIESTLGIDLDREGLPESW